ncbi:MAG: hypothetical protein IJ071_04800 [Ruminococcus sp.]|nr:hypothetical protein [Ruminococcus sp.]
MVGDYAVTADAAGECYTFTEETDVPKSDLDRSLDGRTISFSSSHSATALTNGSMMFLYFTVPLGTAPGRYKLYFTDAALAGANGERHLAGHGL